MAWVDRVLRSPRRGGVCRVPLRSQPMAAKAIWLSSSGEQPAQPSTSECPESPPDEGELNHRHDRGTMKYLLCRILPVATRSTRPSRRRTRRFRCSSQDHMKRSGGIGGPSGRISTCPALTVLLAVGRNVVTERRDVELRLAASEDRYRGLALRDALTGLTKARLLDELLMAALAGTSRSVTCLVVSYFGLDGFKAINDDYGLAAGDAVLMEIGRRSRTTVRKEDIVARIGGDEFVVVQERPPDQIDSLAARLEHLMSEARRHQHSPWANRRFSTIWTAVAPAAVFTFRTNGLTPAPYKTLLSASKRDPKPAH